MVINLSIDNKRLKRLLEAAEDAPDTPSENQPLVQEEPQGTAATPIVSVMTAYQNANRWLDIVKEDLLINKGMVFFSNYIHDLAHTMPVRFDKFGDILHTRNILVPYPPTEDIPYSLNSVSDIFDAIFKTVEAISDSLRRFIESTAGTPEHSMSCKAEDLLIDIDSEFENLYIMKKVFDTCQDPIEFDKWMYKYLENR